MTPTQPIAPDYAAAWDRLSDVVASEMGPVPDLALIEPGIRILELAAAYRVAHAAFEAAPEGEHMEPLRLLEIARCTLLSAALGVLP